MCRASAPPSPIRTFEPKNPPQRVLEGSTSESAQSKVVGMLPLLVTKSQLCRCLPISRALEKNERESLIMCPLRVPLVLFFRHPSTCVFHL